MNTLLFFLLITPVLSLSITIAPLNYSVETTLLFGMQIVEYNLTSTSPVSVLLMNSREYDEFVGQEHLSYDQVCSRIGVTSVNLSCMYFTHTKFQISSVPVYFLIQNTVNESVNLTYSLEYTYGFQYEPWGLFVGSIVVVSIMTVTLCALKRRTRKEEYQEIQGTAL